MVDSRPSYVHGPVKVFKTVLGAMVLFYRRGGKDWVVGITNHGVPKSIFPQVCNRQDEAGE